MAGVIPTGLSPTYWRSYAPRTGLSVNESLENGEEWIGQWDGVGLYEQNNKVPSYQDLIVHLTTHRLLLLQALSEPSSSKKGLQINMSYIRQTEFYVGFMRSSPKITLTLGQPIGEEGVVAQEEDVRVEWSCPVCGHSNASERTPRGEDKCGLCGVSYGKSASMGPNGRATPLSRPSTPVPALASASSPLSSPTPTSTSPMTAVPDTPVGTCPACTFLNHPSLRNCEICDTPIPRPSSTPNQAIIATPTPANAAELTTNIIRLSFRKGGSNECYRRLKNVLSDKAWESRAVNGSGEVTRGTGIDGIMQSINLDSKAKDDRMQDAFKDLEVLMVRAGEMVKLAQSLSSRLPPTPQNTQEETLLRTSLVQLGLPTPALTSDMVRDDRLYLEGLTRELGVVLVGRDGKGGLMGGRGVVGLDEVWVVWMRARGVALLPPNTLISILSDLPRFTDPSINLLTLPSSLKVLHTPHYSTQALLSRVLNRLNPETEMDVETETKTEKSVSVIEVASIENLAIGITQELLESIEMTRKEYGVIGGAEGIVRDEQAGGGVRWYRDLISEWHIDPV